MMARSTVVVFLSLAILAAVTLPSGTPMARAAAASGDTWVWQNPLPQGNTLSGVSCPSKTFCKAVGDNGTIISWDGTHWSMDNSGTTDIFTGVSCVSSTFCKAVTLATTGKAIVTWNGTTWSTDASGGTQSLDGVSCTSTTFCKAVGALGSVLSWNGSTWSTENVSPLNILHAVSCLSSSLRKAVGENGAIDSWNGTSWGLDSSPTTFL